MQFPLTNILPFELDRNDNLKVFYFDDDNTVLKYKIEQKDDSSRFSKLENFRWRDTCTYEETTYNLHNDVNDNNFTPLLNAILGGKNNLFLNILGPAGTGKRYLIKQIQ